MNMLAVILLLGGLVLLVAGAELLVRNASALAGAFGMSPVAIGLTVVAFGTSMPELAISVQAVWGGEPEIAVGNVIGSNIANILLILGLSAVVTPLAVAQKIVRQDVPLMIGASLLFWLLAISGSVSRLEGALLFSLVVLYTLFTLRAARSSSPAIQAEYAGEYGDEAAGAVRRQHWLRYVALFLVGLVIMVGGANMLVEGASAMARALGVSELVIGLTIVAIGTSAPELATSIVAALRGERDIAVGNVVGSNLFNILAVLGMTALTAPAAIPIPQTALVFDIPTMVAVAVACLPIFYMRYTVRRWEGLLFLAYYVAYTLVLYLSAVQSDALSWFRTTMLFFVVPLTVLGISLSLMQELRLRGREQNVPAGEA